MRRSLPHFAIILLVVGSVLAFLWLVGRDMCNNDIAQEVSSPNGKYKAIIFERDCGATTDFSTQVSVLKASKSLSRSDGGNVFVADSNRGVVGTDIKGVMAVYAHWASNSVLEIHYPSGARVFEKNDRIGDVTVHYLTD